MTRSSPHTPATPRDEDAASRRSSDEDSAPRERLRETSPGKATTASPSSPSHRVTSTAPPPSSSHRAIATEEPARAASFATVDADEMDALLGIFDASAAEAAQADERRAARASWLTMRRQYEERLATLLTPGERVPWLLKLAEALRHLDDVEGAQHVLDDASRIAPRDPVVLQARAALCRAREDWIGHLAALDALRAHVDAEHEALEIDWRSGEVAEAQLGDRSRAKAHWRRMLETDAETPEGRALQARARRALARRS